MRAKHDPTNNINHFPVTHNPKTRKTTVQEFGTDYKEAPDSCQKAEQQAQRTILCAVLLSAESLETIKRTHSSYFNTSKSIAKRKITLIRFS